MRTWSRGPGESRFWVFVGNVKVGNFLRDEPTGSVSNSYLAHREVLAEIKACMSNLDYLTRIKLRNSRPCPEE
jgi:hypothetical protein